MEGPEWDVHAHGKVHPGSGVEDTAISSGVVEEGHRQGFQCLWAPPGDGELLQTPGAGDLGGRQKTDDSGE